MEFIVKDEKQRLLLLLESLNNVSASINTLHLRLKSNKLLSNECGIKADNVYILYLKWRSELMQAELRIEKILEDLNRFEKRNVSSDSQN
jgi:hypothetical protein